MLTKGPDISICMDGWAWKTIHHMFVNVPTLAYAAEKGSSIDECTQKMILYRSCFPVTSLPNPIVIKIQPLVN